MLIDSLRAAGGVGRADLSAATYRQNDASAQQDRVANVLAATDETILIADDELAMRTVITDAIGGALWRRICT